MVIKTAQVRQVISTQEWARFCVSSYKAAWYKVEKYAQTEFLLHFPLYLCRLKPNGSHGQSKVCVCVCMWCVCVCVCVWCVCVCVCVCGVCVCVCVCCGVCVVVCVLWCVCGVWCVCVCLCVCGYSADEFIWLTFEKLNHSSFDIIPRNVTAF